MTHTRPSNAPADPDETVPEYLARYAPRKLNRDQWERFRGDFVGLIEAAKPPTPRAAAVLCSVLADFLRFSLASHPSIELAAALTDLHVGRYIAGLTCGKGTRQMRKTNLMLLVNTVHSLPRVRKTRRTPRFAPLTPDELLSMVPVLRGAPDGIRARIWHDVASGIATGSVGHEADHCTITIHADLVYVTSPTGQTSPLGPWQVALSRLAHELEIADDVTIAGHQESAHWLKAAGIDLGPTRLRVAWGASIANWSGLTPSEFLRRKGLPGGALDLCALADGLPAWDETLALLRGTGVSNAPWPAAGTVRRDPRSSADPSRGSGSSHVPSAITPKLSKSDARKMRAAIASGAESEPDPLPDKNATYLAAFKPAAASTRSESEQVKCKEAVTAVMRRAHHIAGEANFAKHCSDVAALATWALSSGQSLDWRSLMDHGQIHAYAKSCPPGLSEKHLAQRMRRLKALARHVNPGTSAPPAPPAVPHTAVKDPYTEAEMAVIERLVRNQPKASVRRQLSAIIGLCRGAGAGSTDLRYAFAWDVQDDGDGGLQVVLGPPDDRRVVPVRRRYEDYLRQGLAGLRPSDPILGKVPTRRNIANDIVARAEVLGTDTPRIEASRLRSTWLADLMTEPIPLGLLLQAAGLKSARSLTDILAWLPDQTVDSATLLRGGEQ